MQDLFEKHRGLGERGAALGRFGSNPLAVSNSQVISPTRAIINGRETILAGTNNYMGVTFDASCDPVISPSASSVTVVCPSRIVPRYSFSVSAR